MSTRVAYVDESHNDELFCLSAIVIRDKDWREAFELYKKMRVHLRESFGIRPHAELHSQKLVSGRGRNFSTRTLGKWERSRVFASMLCTVASIPDVWLFNVALSKRGRKDPQLDAWDRLLNRLNRTAEHHELLERALWTGVLKQIANTVDAKVHKQLSNRLDSFQPRFVIFSDEGREHEITRVFRKMHVFNPIPSQIGIWEDGNWSKNITLSRIVDDPVFRKSDESGFLQLVDAVAFALLKREVRPTENIAKYGIEKMFDKYLAKACYKKACRKDPLGIVRN